jgi:hypothetical protein
VLQRNFKKEMEIFNLAWEDMEIFLVLLSKYFFKEVLMDRL